MTATIKLAVTIVSSALLSVSGCASTDPKKPLLRSDEVRDKLRRVQTRAFDTTEKTKMHRAVISTFQELGFIVNEVNEVIGTVSAERAFVRYRVFKRIESILRITVSVRPGEKTRLLVRANAQYGEKPVEDPNVYLDFFAALEESVSLTAHEVD